MMERAQKIEEKNRVIDVWPEDQLVQAYPKIHSFNLTQIFINTHYFSPSLACTHPTHTYNQPNAPAHKDPV